MKYTITGAAGQIATPLAEQLLHAGHEVTIIGRNENHLKELIRLGAEPAIGSVEDIEFLKEAFSGSDAIYMMCPPNFTTHDPKGFIEQVGRNYVEAIRATNIKFVVNLSSVGAHLPEGVGPVSGLHRVENALNTLQQVHIKHLRPVYFYTNLMPQIGLIKNMGIMGSNFATPAGGFPLVDPVDIAEAAAEELMHLNFTGHSARYIASDERSTDDIAAVLGNALGKPELKWIKFQAEQVAAGLQQAGLSKEVASAYVEMFNSLDEGIMLEDYWKHRPTKLGDTKLEDFAKIFAAAYQAT